MSQRHKPPVSPQELEAMLVAAVGGAVTKRGTSATNFRGRAKAKRVRLRKLQRQARRKQR